MRGPLSPEQKVTALRALRPRRGNVDPQSGAETLSASISDFREENRIRTDSSGFDSLALSFAFIKTGCDIHFNERLTTHGRRREAAESESTKPETAENRVQYW